MNQYKERYASADNIHINAVISGMYRFATEREAIEKLQYFKSQFTTSKKLAEESPPRECVLLWIKDYEVDAKQDRDGYLGNYAFFTYEQLEDDNYTITATKLDIDLKRHPRRKRPKATMPNWGHPILRSVKKGKIYPTIEAITEDLQKLHMEYPTTSVPAQNKMYVMVYGRRDNPKKPVQKYVLEIVAVQGGGFKIEYSINEYEPKEKPAVPKQEEGQEQQPMGHFASMIAAKRNKRNPIINSEEG